MAEKFSFGWTLDALMVSFFTPMAIVKYMILGAKLMPCCLVSFGEVIGSGCQQGLSRGGQINRYRLTDRLPTLTEPI
jgi:hypothetical protein